SDSLVPPDSDDTATAKTTITKSAHMLVAKSASVGDGTADSSGDVITYTITAKNDGNIDLTHVAVSDSVEAAAGTTVTGPASGDANTDGVLNPGETWTYTATHTLTQSELDTKGGDGKL